MSQTILKGIIALFLIAFVILAFSPVIDNLANNPAMWGGVGDSRALFLRDNAVTLFYAAGLMAFIMIIVWMWTAAQSKGAVGN